MEGQDFKPLVSVLMTSYNAEPFIAQAIKSIQDQTYDNWELLIADDCSTDKTRTVIQQFDDDRIRIFHNSQNLHYLRTRNKLTQVCRGEFIALLDADDWYESTKLERQVSEFQKDEELAMCGTLIKYVDGHGRPLSRQDDKPSDYEDIKRRIAHENVFTGSSIMVRSSVWQSLGGYRDFFNSFGYEDYDLTSRLVEKYKAINISSPLYIYRQLEDSSSKNNLLYNPFKLHGHLLVKRFIEERSLQGSDSLERNDIPSIINFILTVNRPYIDDPSRIYRELMWSSLYRKLYKLAAQNILMAIRKRPFKYLNYKALILLVLISLGVVKE